MEHPEETRDYWQTEHEKQSYADKNSGFDKYQHAYRTGYESFFQHHGKKFDEVEEDIALGYEKGRPGSALPWDSVRPAVKLVWDRLGGVISPRDVDRGTRGWI